MDGDSLVCGIVTATSNGVVVVTGNTVTYTPNAGYTGDDYFDFVADDGSMFSNDWWLVAIVHAGLSMS